MRLSSEQDALIRRAAETETRSSSAAAAAVRTKKRSRGTGVWRPASCPSTMFQAADLAVDARQLGPVLPFVDITVAVPGTGLDLAAEQSQPRPGGGGPTMADDRNSCASAWTPPSRA